MRERKIESHPAFVDLFTEPLAVDDIGEVKDWLQTQAVAHGLQWLLVHADDGVIWGKMNNGKLVTSHEAAQHDAQAKEVCPPLRLTTLQQARLFSRNAELLLWRDGDSTWRARLIRAAKAGETPTFTDAFDEPQILWGTDSHPLANTGFTLMSDGSQGSRHIVPLTVVGDYNEQTRPLRLCVRHYIGEDGTGFARIVASRLVELK
jgi:CRISPR-associated protein (TIGR03984 family)